MLVEGEDGSCFSCGGPAPWLILIAGEDETPHEEWACEVHARGHWRWALVTPPPAKTAAEGVALTATYYVPDSAKVAVSEDQDSSYAWYAW
jgi:hypothetical protein